MLHHDHRERYKAPGACLVRACVLGLAERDRGNVAAAYTKCGHTCGPLRQGAPPRPPGGPPLPAPFREPCFSGQAATEQASGCTGAVKAGVATRSAAEGLALTERARTAAILAFRLAGLGSRGWHGR